MYHSSGADFDAFDHSHMGEGEGAQAYGWGTYVTEVEGIGRTYAILTDTGDDLKYDEEQLKRANEWRAGLNLPMITDNDKFFQKHYITRTLFIIIQIIGKTKS